MFIVYVYIYIYIHTCMYVCMYIYIYIYTDILVYRFIQTYVNKPPPPGSDSLRLRLRHNSDRSFCTPSPLGGGGWWWWWWCIHEFSL